MNIASSHGGKAVLLVAALLTVAACSGGAPAATAPTSAATSPAPVIPSGTATPTETVFPDPVELPQSVLRPVEGLTYADLDTGFMSPKCSGSTDCVEAMQGSGDTIAGYVSRTLLYGTEPVGRVQLIRFRPGALGSNAPATVKAIVSRFGQGVGVQEDIGPQTVRLVRGAGGALAAWITGDDLIVVAVAGTLVDARHVAAVYLGQDRPRSKAPAV